MTADGGAAMFDGIAQGYDRLNTLMSFGMHVAWRKALVRALDLGDKGGVSDASTAPASVLQHDVLDVATGTADVALAIARAHPNVRVTGIDPSQGMLVIGQNKVDAAHLSDRIVLQSGDAQSLPYANASFAASCISFGIRNVKDRRLGLKEMCRVTQSGGVVAVLELSEVEGHGLWAYLARFHTHHIVPRLGAWLSTQEAYRYLTQSIEKMVSPKEFMGYMQACGLNDISHRKMGLGSVNLFCGRMP